MKSFEFLISLPEHRTRKFVFYDEIRAQEKLAEYLEKDSRFNPSELSENFSDSNAIIVDENNPYEEHDLTGLNFVGKRKAYSAGATRDESWYAQSGHENEVKSELNKAILQPSTQNPENKRKRKSIFSFRS